MAEHGICDQSEDPKNPVTPQDGGTPSTRTGGHNTSRSYHHGDCAGADLSACVLLFTYVWICRWLPAFARPVKSVREKSLGQGTNPAAKVRTATRSGYQLHRVWRWRANASSRQCPNRRGIYP